MLLVSVRIGFVRDGGSDYAETHKVFQLPLGRSAKHFTDPCTDREIIRLYLRVVHAPFTMCTR